MPQLCPSPWFLILIFTWLVFLAIVIPKIAAHLSPNEVTLKNQKNAKTEPWNWPWP